jgi:hypothetical protein
MRRLIALPLVTLVVACQLVTGAFSIGGGAMDSGTGGSEGGGAGDSATGDVDATADVRDATADATSEVADATADVGDAGGYDALAEAGDAGSDADGGETVYNDITSPSFWTVFDLASVGVGSAAGFHAAAFDGRYIYFIPWNEAPGLVARYDTQGSFTAASSWATYYADSTDAGAFGFFGATFDGRFLYLVPERNGIVTRYDSQGSFTAGSSWSTFDATSVNAGASGFFGAVFDGRYVYLVPNYNGHSDGIIARYDTSAGFQTSSSWLTFDTTTVDANAEGFSGGTFDGRYIYLAPNNANASGSTAVVARYDTQATFGAAASWVTFDVMTVQATANSFAGAVFDGRYVYLAPNGPSGVAARYDTTGSFSAAASWATFATLGSRVGAGFDGRYVYFAPYGTAAARFDTLGSFGISSSWSTFDVAGLDAGVGSGFMGAAFDGRYVYLAPYFTSVVARFDAKTPPSMPKLPGWSGSFL